MPRKLEHSIEQAVVDWAEENGIRSIKMKLGEDSGWPDRMFLLPQCPAFVEFKRGKKRPTPLQMHRMEFLAGLGYKVQWSSSSALTIKWLTILMKGKGIWR